MGWFNSKVAPNAPIYGRARELHATRLGLLWGGCAALIVTSGGLLDQSPLPGLPWVTPIADLLVVLGFSMVGVFAAGDATSSRGGKSLPLAAASCGVVVLWLVPLLSQPGVLPEGSVPGGLATESLATSVARLTSAALLAWALLQPPRRLLRTHRDARLTLLSGAGLSAAFMLFVVLVVSPQLAVAPTRGTAQGRILAALTIAPLVISLASRGARRRQWTDVGILAALCLFSAAAAVSLTNPAPESAGHFALAVLDVLPCVALLLGHDRVHRNAVEEAAAALEAEKARVRELSLLHEAGRALSWSTDRDAILGAAVRQAASLLGPETVRAVVIEGLGGEAVITAEFKAHGGRSSVGVRPPLRPDGPFAAAVTRVSATSWAVGSCYEDVAFTGLETGTGVLAPIRSGGACLGVLAAWLRTTTELDAADLHTLEGIAVMTGLALAHADGFQRLQNLASSDHLTGLLNRREFERCVAAQRGPHAILAVDVDNLKIINDTYGHEAGDATLRSVAAVLRGAVRKDDVVARVGGDEFAVLTRGIDESGAAAIAERIRCAMEAVPTPNRLGRVSIGIAWAAFVDPATELWERADAALYAAKRAGGNRVEVRRATDIDDSDDRYRWEDEIGRLLSEHAVSSVYQPIVRLEDGAIVAVEALARPHGMGPLAHVDGLFATAQRLGLAPDVDWLCRRAAVANIHRVSGRAPLFINVGVSALLDPLHDVDQMQLLLEWAHATPRDVVLEITEREAVRDLARLESVLAAYRAAGFRFALDDVGDGHSTFELIAVTAPEYLKISALLVRRLDERAARLAVRGIVAFARVSQTRIIAEGIESATDSRRLLDLGVPLGQGFALGSPVAPERLGSLTFDNAETYGVSPSSTPVLHVVPPPRRPSRSRTRARAAGQ